MNKKKFRARLDVELFGCISGLLLIICAVAGFLELENETGFFILMTGLGVLVNGILAWLGFTRKKHIFGTVLAVLTAALLVLFVVQILLEEGIL